MTARETLSRNNFGALLAQTSRLWRRAADHYLQPFGLTEATWLPLVHIARVKTPMRQKDLAALLSLDGSSVVRLLDNLEKASLIQRQEEATDRRAKAMILTKKGRATADQVEKIVQQVREEALADLTIKDIETALRVLDHVRAKLTAIVEESAS